MTTRGTPMTAATAEAVSEIEWVAPKSIVAAEEQNPRKTMDPEKYLELRSSIETVGIFTPLLVKRLTADSYELVAGYRRHSIAVELGLEQVPVAIVDEKQDSFDIAVTENLQREDFSLADEIRIVARHLQTPKATHKKIAKILNKGEAWVSTRAAMAGLTDEGLAILAGGNIPAAHCELLARKLASQPQLLEPTLRVVQLAFEDEKRSFDEFECEWVTYLADVMDPELGGSPDQVYCVAPNTLRDWSRMASTDPATQEIIETAQTVTYFDIKQSMPKLTDDAVIDAARAFGCLLEVEEKSTWRDEPDTYTFFTDREWVQGQILGMKADIEKAAKKQVKAAEKAAKETPAGQSGAKQVGTNEPKPELTKEQKAKERENESKAYWKAHRHNHALWADGINNLGKIKVDVPVGFVDYLLDRGRSFLKTDGYSYQTSSDFWAQLDKMIVLLDPQFTEPVEGHRPKFAVKKGEEKNLAIKWIDKGKSAKEKLQRYLVLQGMAAAADTTVLPQSSRPMFSTGHTGAGLKKLMTGVLSEAQVKKIR